MFTKIRGKINLYVAKSPKKAVLIGIMLLNLIFILIAAGIIAVLSRYMSGLNQHSFWESVYYTITMILDAGCIDNVISDVGAAGTFAAVLCLVVVILGMIVFTGAIIGYITNSITDFIDSKNNGKNKLRLSDHIVIINWNSRGSEIINEFLYAEKSVKIVVFVPDHREEAEEAIRNRLDMTLMGEAQQVCEETEGLSYFEKKRLLKKAVPKEKMTYIVREGDVASAGDLDDISISAASTVIILNQDPDSEKAGNTEMIKTLIQVSEISKARMNQAIFVEIDDRWTEELVENIIAFRGKSGEEQIIPVPYNRLLGRINAQFALMPEYIDLYDHLYTVRETRFGAEDLPGEFTAEKAPQYIERKLSESDAVIPLTVTEIAEGPKGIFVTTGGTEPVRHQENCGITTAAQLRKAPIFTFKKRNIIVIGHNRQMGAFMRRLDNFRTKHHQADGSEILNIIMIDRPEVLARANDYDEYPFVTTIAADIFDGKAVQKQVYALTGQNTEKTTVMILAGDHEGTEDTDVFTHLIYLQQFLHMKEMQEPDFKRENYEIIAEIRNPKNEAIVKNYGVDRVMNSGRIISRIIAQISLERVPVEFFSEMMDFYPETIRENRQKISLAAAEDFFEVLPEKCTAAALIRMIYAGGEGQHPFIMLGYIRGGKDYVFFCGDQRAIDVTLQPKDQLILFGREA